jgi:alpha-ribazole phosphatase CobZ
MRRIVNTRDKPGKTRISLKIPIDTVHSYIEGNSLIIRSKKGLLKILSSAVLNGGLCLAKTVLNYQVSRDFDHSAPAAYLRKIARRLQLPNPVVGLMTAANVLNVSVQSSNSGNSVCVFTTAGLSNTAAAGDPVTSKKPLSTINTIVLIDGNLSDASMVDAVKTVTEAKTVALRELDVRSRFSRKIASGTTTDAVVVACTGRGKQTCYAGTATEIGEAISVNVIKSVKEAIGKEEKLTSNRPLIKRLEEKGITFDSLIETALELLTYHPNMGSRGKVVQTLKDCLHEALSDVNVAALVLAGIRLDDDGSVGLIPELTAEAYKGDPVFLLADEILGINVANYIAGSRGVFEFVRFDKAKPGILKKLSPFLDDVIGGLIAGASSNMYTRLLR